MSTVSTKDNLNKILNRYKIQGVYGNKNGGVKSSLESINYNNKRYELDEWKDLNLEITHTSIGDKNKGIYPGKFCIPEDKIHNFQCAYYNYVFNDNGKMYLTEKQDRANGGPILIDLDFKYGGSFKYTNNIIVSGDNTKRKHDNSNIYDTIEIYVEELKNMFNLENKEFDIFVFERDNPTFKNTVTGDMMKLATNKKRKEIDDDDIKNTDNDIIMKDGVHIIIGLHLKHTEQMVLRKKVMASLITSGVWEMEGQVNDMENILDISITRGSTPWQLYGSRKPGCKSYKLKKVYNIEIGEGDDFEITQQTLTSLQMSELFPKMSARYKDHMIPELKNEYLEEVEKMKKNMSGGGGKVKKYNRKYRISSSTKLTISQYDDIKSKQDLDEYVNDFIQNINNADYDIKDIHQYVMILTKEYYSNFEKWIRVGWALHNTDDILLFNTWLMFSAQWEHFNFETGITECMDRWNQMSHEGLSHKSIEYWCNNCNPIKFKEIQSKTISKMIKESIQHHPVREYDIARITFALYGNDYKCINHKKNLWYKFHKNRWVKSDDGVSIRSKLSSKLCPMYVDAAIQSRGNYGNSGQIDEKKSIESAKYNNVVTKLGQHSYKTSVFKECKVLFYDNTIVEKLDVNPYLLGFKNGVYDIENKCFRKGNPEDFISKSTNIDYIPIDRTKKEHTEILETIDDFMAKLFTDEELRKYMWEHAASIIIGRNTNQTFQIYTGSGANGKSMFVDLMNSILGDYSKGLDIAVFTQKRAKAGQASPEIASLAGTRFVHMEEPSKGDKINEGILKQYTGNDLIKARQLYGDPFEFRPQFNLVCCCNDMPEFKSNDGGTWRRVRVCPYESKFVYKPSKNPEDKQFQRDDEFWDTLDKCKELFMSRLIEIAVEKRGKVTDCNKVTKATADYEETQNHIMRFVSEKIEKDSNSRSFVRWTDIVNSFNIWYERELRCKAPRPKDLEVYIEKNMTKMKKKRLFGYRLKYDYDEDDEEE